ncbi:FAD-dependent oxidoreductase [Saccharopolyspora erythraea]|uniref:NAD(P)/FAD-dependent oxidoreductase n=1 Tax=Saccharopolyspora erythraea TaxID=1836 RepID=UPI001BA92238|nr:FAD-dependent oxidoreductase [Saccharopolyspora erythraea]QUH02430.1 FAD-dependent oxidoreductase [Saccharopolyspora erythraea]
MSRTREHVLVVGAGIAGLCVAHQLNRRGVRVTVCESVHAGAGASHGNAGWVNPAQTGPLPEAGLALDGLRKLRNADSALHVSPRAVPALGPWLLKFARHCTPRRYAAGARALGELGRRTFPLLDQLADDGVDFTHRRTSLLAVARDPRAVQNFLHALRPLRLLTSGLPETALNGPALREREPALSELVRAGVEIHAHVQVDPASLVAGLAEHLRARGVVIEEGVTVTGLSTTGDEAGRLSTTAGEREAGSVVIATGAAAATLTGRLGRRMPVVAGKGYSFDVPTDVLPDRSTLLLDAHVACAPMGARLRIAGGMEFSGQSARIDQRRVDAVVRGARPMLRGVDWRAEREIWMGMRPIAPDGLPIVDRFPGYRNVFVATAYAMLGMTLAAPAAEALTTFLLEGTRPAVLEPFRADRFARRTAASTVHG